MSEEGITSENVYPMFYANLLKIVYHRTLSWQDLKELTTSNEPWVMRF